MGSKVYWALRHIAEGLTVYPTQHNSKWNFAGEKKTTRATNDPDRAVKTWANERFNIKALITRGFVCLDFDPKHDGDKTYAALVKAGKIDPEATYIERSASGGFHVWYRVPETIHTRNVITIPDLKGLEIKGEGNDATLAGSVVDGVPYTVETDSSITQAPQWLIELLQANEPTPFAYKPLPEALAKSDVTARERAWSERAADGICSELSGTPTGSRHAALIKASLRLGNLTPHYFDASTAAGMLENITAAWGNEVADRATIDHYLAIGAATPRRLDVEQADAYRAASRDAAREYKATLTPLSPYGKIQVGSVSMNADSIKAAALAMIDKAERAGDLIISMSKRELSELADLGTNTAQKALKGLELVGFSERTAERSKEHAKKAQIVDEALAQVWLITQKGIDALLENLGFGGARNDTRYQNYATNKLLGKGKEEPSFFSPTGFSGVVLIPTQEGIVTSPQSEEETLENLRKQHGVFKHGVLPRKLEQVLTLLKASPHTTGELIEATGLPKLTIIRLLKKAVEFELITRGARGMAHTLRSDYVRQIVTTAQGADTYGKRQMKASRHDTEQEAFQKRMKDRKERQIEWAKKQAEREAYFTENIEQKADWE